MRYLDLATYLPGDIMTKVDRASMAVGLEARAPLLDYRLIELSWRIPTSVHLSSGQGKWILKHILEQYVPRSLFERPKMGFGIPIGGWLRCELRDWAEDLLSEDSLNQTGILQAKPIRNVWKQHLDGTINAQYQLWSVLMFQAWQRQYAGYSAKDSASSPAAAMI
jgi:asparagine synthase (glutamine-hydrolysing)